MSVVCMPQAVRRSCCDMHESAMQLPPLIADSRASLRTVRRKCTTIPFWDSFLSPLDAWTEGRLGAAWRHVWLYVRSPEQQTHDCVAPIHLNYINLHKPLVLVYMKTKGKEEGDCNGDCCMLCTVCCKEQRLTATLLCQVEVLLLAACRLLYEHMGCHAKYVHTISFVKCVGTLVVYSGCERRTLNLSDTRADRITGSLCSICS